MRLPPSLASLIPDELGPIVARKQLQMPQAVAGKQAGRHRSFRPDMGREFREYRSYVPGDDPRKIDWRAAARRDRWLLRRSEGERELNLVLLIDAGANMAYGDGKQNKWAWVRSLSAVLSAIASRQGDRVMALIGHEGRVDEIGRGRSARQASLPHLGEILQNTSPAGACPWHILLDKAAANLPARSMVVILSDFLDPCPEDNEPEDTSFLSKIAAIAAAGHAVHLLQLLHPHESNFSFDDAQTLRLLDPQEVRPPLEGPAHLMGTEYQERLRAHLNLYDRFAETTSCLLFRQSTAGAPAEYLARILDRQPAEPNQGDQKGDQAQ